MKVHRLILSLAVLAAAIAAPPAAARAAPIVERAAVTAPPVATQPVVHALTATYRLVAVDSLDIELVRSARPSSTAARRSFRAIDVDATSVHAIVTLRQRPPSTPFCAVGWNRRT